jgi:hypothetical protein
VVTDVEPGAGGGITGIDRGGAVTGKGTLVGDVAGGDGAGGGTTERTVVGGSGVVPPPTATSPSVVIDALPSDVETVRCPWAVFDASNRTVMRQEPDSARTFPAHRFDVIANGGVGATDAPEIVTAADAVTVTESDSTWPCGTPPKSSVDGLKVSGAPPANGVAIAFAD